MVVLLAVVLLLVVVVLLAVLALLEPAWLLALAEPEDTEPLDEEAYRYVQWRALFLIAGMLPMGLALQSSGAAGMLAGALLKAAGDFGSLGVLAAIYVVGALAAQIMPSPAVALLMGPIALTASAQSGVSSRQLMMVLAVAASSSFFSPVGHPANVLVMGPGGYRFSDFVRVGLPLTLLIMLVALLTVPVFIR